MIFAVRAHLFATEQRVYAIAQKRSEPGVGEPEVQLWAEAVFHLAYSCALHSEDLAAAEAALLRFVSALTTGEWIARECRCIECPRHNPDAGHKAA